MPQRPIIGATKSGSITRREARQAFRTASSRRLLDDRPGDRRASVNPSDALLSDRVRERYLGHFGTGATRPVVKKSGTAKATTKKVGTRKSTKKAAGKRASTSKLAKKSSTRKISRKAS